ncbi:glycoside hydrolase family 43 protein [Chitinophaga sp. SYP-B3965]|uniref:glycoside hydrolase family 43 protein n=1 Tax=Chitinophaga sp. SYP-B3965 TaxID=2663120 RepID=UPI001566CB74|nr:glycoside hydrolase family 43 protein [Chitinophaga sp. SYP-B3965]
MKFLLLLLLATAQKKDSIPMLLADPTIFTWKGTHYAFGTNRNDGFPVFVSKDLKHWADSGMALKKGEAFGEKGFWAPQVFHYGSKFYMAYTANEEIAIASSDHPAGPYKQQDLRSIAADKKQIDPFVFFDEGKIYLYHVRLDSGNRIFVGELNKELNAFIPGTVQKCMQAGEGWENTKNAPWPVMEGPTVIKKDKLYYLFYSCNDFRNIDYAVGVAVSSSPVGPWKRYEGNPIISRKNTGANGSGHGDVLHVGNKWYYVFHTHFDEQKVSPRKTYLVEMKWGKGFPEIIPATIRAIYIASGAIH